MARNLPSDGPALTVDHVSKTFKVHHERATSLKQFVAMRGRNRYEEFYALRDVSFEIRSGEALGIIGHNGSGKSTLLKCMAGILRPNAGTITVHRRMSALLELGAGFHPDLTGRDNIFLNAAILGMARQEIARRFDAIVEFSGLEQFIDTPVKTYSSGMYVRLAFAVAINVDPEMLLIDEILAVGDVSFQQKCMEKFVEFREESRTLVLVTHDLGSIRNFCDRVIWLDHGKIVEEGDPTELVDRYTEAMLSTGTADVPLEGARRGSGEIKVERVEMLVDGRRTTQPRTGDAVVIRLYFRASEPVPSPAVVVRIGSLGGPIVTAPCSRDTHAVPAFVGGTGTIDVEIEDLSLLPGPHVIHTEILAFNRDHVYDHLQNASRFDVIAGRGAENEGLVTLNPRWVISGEGVADRSEKFPGG